MGRSVARRGDAVPASRSVIADEPFWNRKLARLRADGIVRVRPAREHGDAWRHAVGKVVGDDVLRPNQERGQTRMRHPLALAQHEDPCARLDDGRHLDVLEPNAKVRGEHDEALCGNGWEPFGVGHASGKPIAMTLDVDPCGQQWLDEGRSIEILIDEEPHRSGGDLEANRVGDEVAGDAIVTRDVVDVLASVVPRRDRAGSNPRISNSRVPERHDGADPDGARF